MLENPVDFGDLTKEQIAAMSHEKRAKIVFPESSPEESDNLVDQLKSLEKIFASIFHVEL